MVVGVHGANGPCAQKRVALDPSIAVGPVPIQVQHTEENSAPEKAKRRETATPVLVQHTAVGVPGVPGRHVPRPVEQDRKSENEPV